MTIFTYEESQMIMRLVLACVLGGLIGLERASGDRPAGFRTHTLVCMGSCLFMLVSIYGFAGMGTVRDPARLAAQVVSGIGFLGAGTILHEGVNVKGLTTAASIWMISAIGLAVGAGLYSIGVFATALMLSTLLFLGRWGRIVNFARHSELYLLTIKAEDRPGNIEKITEHLRIDGAKIKSVNIKRDLMKETIALSIQVRIANEKIDCFNDILAEIKNFASVTGLENITQIK
ncbi:MAG: MgtC/SapB family protein [Acidaminococcales bacterium]|jgi:putative Mg2+ transporter-C (MgtC) family protein|nr:MgtC/SapB family protein [Acidaminococcales bacterium]